MSQKVAYVTGGMGGIGTAICQRLAKDGFKVIAGCGPNSPRKDRWIGEQKVLGYDFIASEGNVSDWDSTVAAFDKVKAEVGRVDVLVNNDLGNEFYLVLNNLRKFLIPIELPIYFINIYEWSYTGHVDAGYLPNAGQW